MIVSGHGFSFHMAALGPSFAAGRRLHPQGDSLARVVLHLPLSGTKREQFNPYLVDGSCAAPSFWGVRRLNGCGRGVE
ncbi:hypothetical protein pben1_p28 [Paracoccus phage vB_PbeS_Pben1]|nr:hypothetical protein pben1_p28 [Paracoccus phage vB_PbeS_Pben1]